MWQTGDSINPMPDWAGMIPPFCETLFTDPRMIELRKERFDVAMVDLILNSCGTALAYNIGGIE